ncbi:hypothetical protein KBY93_16010 [Synechococcus sp. J7-Johnson]|uniref:hypothetical protein n=1 Tax=Synechococcus sp. J7-Johnson TaxID=2823737 RepID=UPI0020CE00EF|nr:hypothetical protein [Synechococcus sp. J7-Johnson]MCP9842099.1 hypothetical protein [Synechococcus sp. J7-Johnson]
MNTPPRCSFSPAPLETLVSGDPLPSGFSMVVSGSIPPIPTLQLWGDADPISPV